MISVIVGLLEVRGEQSRALYLLERYTAGRDMVRRLHTAFISIVFAVSDTTLLSPSNGVCYVVKVHKLINRRFGGVLPNSAPFYHIRYNLLERWWSAQLAFCNTTFILHQNEPICFIIPCVDAVHNSGMPRKYVLVPINIWNPHTAAHVEEGIQTSHRQRTKAPYESISVVIGHPAVQAVEVG